MSSNINDYEKLVLIGEGVYGRVYKARCRTTGEIVALKSFKPMDPNVIDATTLRELALLTSLQNYPNVVRMLNVCHEEKSVMIPNTHTGVPTNVMTMIVTMVLEYLPMNLSQDMKQQKRLPQYTVKLYMSHLLIGLSQMHKCGIMHRDLKPENLLVDTARRVLKIADLGMARKHEPGRTFTHEVVTQNYRPPEVLLGDGRYDCSVDMWSVGCIFAEMAENQPLFGLKVLSEKRQLDDIFRLRGTPTEHTWPGVTALGGWHARDQWSVVPLADRCPHLGADGLDLLERLLSLNPAMRLDALTALHHPYFDEVAHTRRPHEVAVLPPRHESHPATPSPQPIRKSTL